MKQLPVFLALTGAILPRNAAPQEPVMQWDFETVDNGTTREITTGITDTIEGLFERTEGVTGRALRLDGFTTRVTRSARDEEIPGREFTLEAWIALGEYPLNWCPVLATASEEAKGYRLMIGPYGQVSFAIAIGEQWISCNAADGSVPLHKWMHLAGVGRAGEDMILYINGAPVCTVPLQGSPTYPSASGITLGMVHVPGRPSNTIRTWGTVPAFYGLDGILDEVRVYDRALTADQVKERFSKPGAKVPDIPLRRLPVIEKDPGRFGAYYIKLDYYPAWDRLWPVDHDPDIVVCFEDNPARFVFWRGIRYGPAWVSENALWMTDQSLETWGTGANDTEGCFEHMQDRHCRFSHVRIIENNGARAVVHWRYAPVSAHDHTWMPDPKTGWECWVDEYYTIYPDGSAVRRVSWNRGTTGSAVQFQESLPLTQPGQQRWEVIEDGYVHVADYNGNRAVVSMEAKRPPAGWTGDYTVQQYQFKSRVKPFICFEPGNEMWIRWIGGGYNHFPVNQARSDGRWAVTSDRPTHFASSPCSDPVIHEDGHRLCWIGLYGMNDWNMDELVVYGRSWAFPPGISLKSRGYSSTGYDRTQRCYLVENTAGKAHPVELVLQGTGETPVINPAILVKNWNAGGAKVLVNGKENRDGKTGINHTLGGDDLVVYLPLRSELPVRISIMP